MLHIKFEQQFLTCLIIIINCGIGACDRDSGSCASNIVNMVVSTIQGVIEAVDLLYLQDQVPVQNLASACAAKKIGKATLKGMSKGVKKWFRNISKDKLKNIMVRSVKEKLKGQFTDAALNATVNSMSSNVATAFKNKINQKESSFDFSILDITGINNAVSSCKGDNGVQCARAITEVVSLIDPTCLTTIAAAFMHSTCEGV